MAKLTAASVEKLKPDPARRLEIPDARMPGLYLVVQPSGVKGWAVRYRHRGKPRKLTLGTVAALDLGHARELARDALHEVQRGRDPAELKKREKAALVNGNGKIETFGQAAREFIERHARPQNRSWREQARLLGLRPFGDEFVAIPDSPAALWADRRLAELTKADVRDFLDAMVDRDVGVAANRTLSVIGAVFNRLIERDVVAASPCAGLKKPAQETDRDRVLSDEELRHIWHAADHVGYPFGPFIQTLMLTGQRRREVAGMGRSEVVGGAWLIPKERVKNGHAHEVPLVLAAQQIIDATPRIDGGLVFTTTGDAPISGFSRAKRLLDAATARLAGQPLARWALHDIRRTVASGLGKLKVPPHVIEAVLNHKSGTIKGVAATYNRHAYTEEKREALELWAKHIEAITKT